MFEKKLNKELLKLSQICYGGELYYLLKNYRLKRISVEKSNLKEVPDILLSSRGNDTFYSYKNDESGFCANLFENIKNKSLVIAYRGTERIGLGENISDTDTLMKDVMTDVNLITGNFDEQFNDAYEFYKLVREQNPFSKIYITGHSLGGALAQLIAAKIYCTSKKKVDTFTYNAPGCKHLLDIFGYDRNSNYSFITNYAVMNDWCGMYGEKIGQTFLIYPICLNETEDNSPLNILNNVLLTTHEGIFDYTEELNGNIFKKPADFNQAEGLSLWYFDSQNPIKDVNTLPEFISSITPNFNIPQFSEIGNSIKNAAEKYFKEKGINIPSPDISGFQEFSDKVKEAAANFIDEQKNKLIQLEIITEQDTDKPVNDATEEFIAQNTQCREKLMENINNNVVMVFSKLIETAVSEVSIESLEKALAILQREQREKHCRNCIESVKTYILSFKS